MKFCFAYSVDSRREGRLHKKIPQNIIWKLLGSWAHRERERESSLHEALTCSGGLLSRFFLSLCYVWIKDLVKEKEIEMEKVDNSIVPNGWIV